MTRILLSHGQFVSDIISQITLRIIPKILRTIIAVSHVYSVMLLSCSVIPAQTDTSIMANLLTHRLRTVEPRIVLPGCKRCEAIGQRCEFRMPQRPQKGDQRQPSCNPCRLARQPCTFGRHFTFARPYRGRGQDHTRGQQQHRGRQRNRHRNRQRNRYTSTEAELDDNK